MDSPLSDLCSFGAGVTVDTFQIQKGNLGSKRACRSNFCFVCSHCNNRACKPCVREVLKKIPKNYRDEDGWCIIVESSLEHDEYSKDISIPFCHSCEWKYHKMPNHNPAPERNKEVIPPPKIQSIKKRLNRKKNKSMARKIKRTKAGTVQDLSNFSKASRPLNYIPTRYSGYLHFLGCKLLVGPPLNGTIDIHGMGEIKGHTSGVYHCCLSHATSVRLHQNNVLAIPFPHYRTDHPSQCQVMQLTVPKPYPEMKNEFKCEVIIMEISPPTESEAYILKGTNDPPDDTIRSCYFFDDSSVLADDIDCTVIIGKMPTEMGEDDPLLLLRFHGLHDYSQQFALEGLGNLDTK